MPDETRHEPALSEFPCCHHCGCADLGILPDHHTMACDNCAAESHPESGLPTCVVCGNAIEGRFPDVTEVPQGWAHRACADSAGPRRDGRMMPVGGFRVDATDGERPEPDLEAPVPTMNEPYELIKALELANRQLVQHLKNIFLSAGDGLALRAMAKEALRQAGVQSVEGTSLQSPFESYENPATYMALTMKPQGNGQTATDVTEQWEAMHALCRAACQFVSHEPDSGRKQPGHRRSLYRRVAEYRKAMGNA